MLENLLLVGESTSPFSSTQITAITNALTTAVGAVIDTFVDLLPVIAIIVGALWGIRFILHTFGKIY